MLAECYFNTGIAARLGLYTHDNILRPRRRQSYVSDDVIPPALESDICGCSFKADSFFTSFARRLLRFGSSSCLTLTNNRQWNYIVGKRLKLLGLIKMYVWSCVSIHLGKVDRYLLAIFL